jgi:hypothetical protein
MGGQVCSSGGLVADCDSCAGCEKWKPELAIARDSTGAARWMLLNDLLTKHSVVVSPF